MSSNKMGNINSQQTNYFDFLRVAGAFAVMVIHVTSQTFETTSVFSFEWAVMNFFDSIVRWAVPIFAMISGSLFLSRDIPLKKIYGKYVLRMFTAFWFWSFVYALAVYAAERNLVDAIGRFIMGTYHLWFLLMIAGLYMILPFVKKIAESESLTKYFLVLSFVAAFIFPETVQVISLFSETFGTFAEGFVDDFKFHFAAGYTGYFLLGYCLNNATISRKAERLIYFAGILGFSATVLMSLYASRFKGEAFRFFEPLTVNVLCEAVAIFLFFKRKFNFPSKLIRTLSQYSFGAYLVHIAVMWSLDRVIGINTSIFNPIFSIPVISVMVFIISFAISAVLNNIPVLRKYIV